VSAPPDAPDEQRGRGNLRDRNAQLLRHVTGRGHLRGVSRINCSKDVFARVEPMGWSHTGNGIRVGPPNEQRGRGTSEIAMRSFSVT